MADRRAAGRSGRVLTFVAANALGITQRNPGGASSAVAAMVRAERNSRAVGQFENSGDPHYFGLLY